MADLFPARMQARTVLRQLAVSQRRWGYLSPPILPTIASRV